MNRVIFLFFIFIVVSLVSCTTSRKMVYINTINNPDSSNFYQKDSRINFETRIQKNDVLWITVGGPNSKDLLALNSALGFGGQGSGVVASQGAQVFGYLVESDGNVKLPYVGKVYAEGLTRIQLEDTLKMAFKEFTIEPVVNVRFLNYKVTVIGEVLRPGVFTLPNERVTILEAIGMAGDMTIMGKRESVTVVREVNGKREIGKINLLSSDLFNSPYYYLQTNDVVYVEPAPAKFFARERLPQFISLAAGSLSLLAILLSINK